VEEKFVLAVKDARVQDQNQEAEAEALLAVSNKDVLDQLKEALGNAVVQDQDAQDAQDAEGLARRAVRR